MSGQPNKYPTDAAKYREQYLSTLNLQAVLNDNNLQANKIFIKTGQTPSQLLDTRLTTEKLQDIEKLKIDIREQLSQIADGQQASAIVNNLDNSQIQFLAQHINEIITILKPKYKYGILSSIFIPFLETYMDSANKTNEVNFGLQQGNIILSNQQILNDILSDELLKQIKIALDQNSDKINQRALKDIEGSIAKLIRVIPSEDFYIDLAQMQDQKTKAMVEQQLSDLMQVLPTKGEVQNILLELQKGISANDPAYIQQMAFKLDELLTVQPEILKDLKTIKDNITPFGISPSEVAQEKTVKPEIQTWEDIPTDKLREIIALYDVIPIATPPNYLISDDPVVLRQYINEVRKILDDSPIVNNNKLGIRSNSTTKKLQNAVKDIFDNLDKLQTTIKPMGGTGIKKTIKKIIKGKGIHNNNINNNIDYSKGIEPEFKKYAQFGRFYINLNKLNNDIISLSRGKGINVSEIPVKRVSKNLSSVIKHIIDKKIPEYTNLKNDEKKYLYEISRKANILERLQLESPNKSEEDKLIDTFEIMKGEILSGNDNKDYIKKFKLLIVKLIDEKLLPNNQGKNILIDLASLGY